MKRMQEIVAIMEDTGQSSVTMDGAILLNQFINSGAGSRLNTSRTPKLH
jgi:hypothetical protein